MKPTQRCFLALIPPEPFFTQVEQWKVEMMERFQTKAALRSPAHITLHMPFHVTEAAKMKLVSCLSELAASQKPFEVSHTGFGAFPPKVIFVEVAPAPALLVFRERLISALRQNVHLLNADYKDLPFHPHMTLAFRDLKKALFIDAWTAFVDRACTEQWLAEGLWLLRHDGKRWQRDQFFQFSNE